MANKVIAAVLMGITPFILRPSYAQEFDIPMVLSTVPEIEPEPFWFSVDDTIYKDAITPVLNKIEETEPTIIAFGEHHYYGDKQTTLERFIEDILPKLVELGYDSLVTEFLIYETPQEELRYFHETGEIGLDTPNLMLKSFIGTDKGWIKLLQKCGELNITLYGGGISSTDIPEYLDILGYMKSHKEESETISEMIEALRIKWAKSNARNSFEYLRILGSEGRKTVFYGGAGHNDLSMPNIGEDFSFGDELSDLTSYLAVDIVVPELMKGTNISSNNPALLHYRFYEPFAFLDGFRVFYTEKGHMVLVYPEKEKNQ